MTQSAPPAAAGPRRCAIATCNKPLSRYNQDDVCSSHTPEEKAQFREGIEKQSKESRALFSFIKDFHKVGTVKEILAEANKAELTPARRRAVIELERYPEALGLLKVASLIFRLSPPRILSKGSKSEKAKVARDVLTYLMLKDLEMEREDVAVFFGYTYLPRVAEAEKRITTAMLEDFDEDLVLAVDLVRDEFNSREERDN